MRVVDQILGIVFVIEVTNRWTLNDVVDDKNDGGRWALSQVSKSTSAGRRCACLGWSKRQNAVDC